ncbi:MAG: TIGR03088 family PEP-CTERM/XrtA system glycosyltransferase [Burkholderiales bacterium]
MPEVPLVAHVIHHLVIGGLENGLVNLINRMPASRYRHAIVCMTRYSDFRNRIQNPTVEVFALNRRDGSDWPARVELFRLIRRLKPAIVHSRGMSGLDSMLPAMLNGVSARIHGEHGRDMDDLDGTNLKAQWVRRLHRPFISHYIALSKDLKSYLEKKIRVPERRITQIYNGVDCQYFRPALSGRAPLPESGFANDTSFIIGTVGRMQAVKDQVNLTKAFILLATLLPEKKHQLRLVIVGDGPLWAQCGRLLDVAGLRHLAWLPGARDDVADLMRGMDLFILPSLAEGISNTILEAMACGLPVIATQVGGNPELVEEGITGNLIPAADPGALAEAIIPYLLIPGLCANRGRAGRIRTESQFSIESMVDSYMRVYDRVLERKTVQTVMQS